MAGGTLTYVGARTLTPVTASASQEVAGAPSTKDGVPALSSSVSQLASAGGQVTLSIEVSRAGPCQLTSSPSIEALAKFTTCPRGATQVEVLLPANDAASATEYLFRLRQGLVPDAWSSVSVEGKPVSSAPTSTNNWAGYEETGGSAFSSVSGSWTVTQARCAGRSSSLSAWLGIGGSTRTTIQQEGTVTSCASGTPSSHAWIEMLGDTQFHHGYAVALSTTRYPVQLGDQMSGVVVAPQALTSGKWLFLLSNQTAGWSYSALITSPAYTDQSLAEWVIEPPEACTDTCSRSPLLASGTVAFTKISASTSQGLVVQPPLAWSCDNSGCGLM